MENTETNTELSEEEIEKRLEELIGGSARNQDVQTVHEFLNAVATSDDTTKTGFLSEEELGMPKLPLRTHKELALFCDEIANMKYMADYFNKKAEILTATSLSKNAKLLNLAVLNRRETADVTKSKPKPKKSWFKKKGSEDDDLEY